MGLLGSRFECEDRDLGGAGESHRGADGSEASAYKKTRVSFFVGPVDVFSTVFDFDGRIAKEGDPALATVSVA